MSEPIGAYLIPLSQLAILVAIYVQLLRFTGRIVALETRTKAHEEQDREFHLRMEMEQRDQWQAIRVPRHLRGNGEL